MNKNKAVNAWTDINSLLQTHKIINVGALIVFLVQMFVIIGLAFQSPVVIVSDDDGRQEYYNSSRQEVALDKTAIEEFVKKFLKIRYEWDGLSADEKKKSLGPIVTDGLNKKLFKIIKNLSENDFQGKLTKQAIVNIEVSVTDVSVTATFDKLLHIEGIPIPVPTSVALQIDRGSKNKWNPVGLYVNGIKEHQSK